MGISLALVGCGSFGWQFAPLFRDHPDVSRFALCDQDPDKLGRAAREFGIAETYSDLDELLASDIEAVALITQPWRHAAQALAALAAGKHVYSAVPAARTLDDCGRLIEAVERSGLVYLNGETSYYRAEAVFCRERARAGDFGQIALIEAEYLHDLDHGLREVYRRRWGADWSPAKTGDAPMHYPTHSVCFPVSITGARVVSVSCLGHRVAGDDWHRTDTEAGNPYGNEIALLELADGSAARICEFRRVGHGGAEQVTRVIGTEATYEAYGGYKRWCTKNGSEPVETPLDFAWLPEPLASNRGGHGGSHAHLVHEFVRAIVEERLPAIHVWEAVRYCAPGLVAHQSALRGGERLPVPDFGYPAGE